MNNQRNIGAALDIMKEETLLDEQQFQKDRETIERIMPEFDHLSNSYMVFTDDKVIDLGLMENFHTMLVNSSIYRRGHIRPFIDLVTQLKELRNALSRLSGTTQSGQIAEEFTAWMATHGWVVHDLSYTEMVAAGWFKRKDHFADYPDGIATVRTQVGVVIIFD